MCQKSYGILAQVAIIKSNISTNLIAIKSIYLLSSVGIYTHLIERKVISYSSPKILLCVLLTLTKVVHLDSVLSLFAPT